MNVTAETTLVNTEQCQCDVSVESTVHGVHGSAVQAVYRVQYWVERV